MSDKRELCGFHERVGDWGWGDIIPSIATGGVYAAIKLAKEDQDAEARRAHQAQAPAFKAWSPTASTAQLSQSQLAQQAALSARLAAARAKLAQPTAQATYSTPGAVQVPSFSIAPLDTSYNLPLEGESMSTISGYHILGGTGSTIFGAGPGAASGKFTRGSKPPPKAAPAGAAKWKGKHQKHQDRAVAVANRAAKAGQAATAAAKQITPVATRVRGLVGAAVTAGKAQGKPLTAKQQQAVARAAAAQDKHSGAALVAAAKGKKATEAAAKLTKVLQSTKGVIANLKNKPQPKIHGSYEVLGAVLCVGAAPKAVVATPRGACTCSCPKCGCKILLKVAPTGMIGSAALDDIVDEEAQAQADASMIGMDEIARPENISPSAATGVCCCPNCGAGLALVLAKKHKRHMLGNFDDVLADEDEHVVLGNFDDVLADEDEKRRAPDPDAVVGWDDISSFSRLTGVPEAAVCHALGMSIGDDPETPIETPAGAPADAPPSLAVPVGVVQWKNVPGDGVVYDGSRGFPGNSIGSANLMPYKDGASIPGFMLADLGRGGTEWAHRDPGVWAGNNPNAFHENPPEFKGDDLAAIAKNSGLRNWGQLVGNPQGALAGLELALEGTLDGPNKGKPTWFWQAGNAPQWATYEADKAAQYLADEAAKAEQAAKDADDARKAKDQAARDEAQAKQDAENALAQSAADTQAGIAKQAAEAQQAQVDVQQRQAELQQQGMEAKLAAQQAALEAQAQAQELQADAAEAQVQARLRAAQVSYVEQHPELFDQPLESVGPGDDTGWQDPGDAIATAEQGQE